MTMTESEYWETHDPAGLSRYEMDNHVAVRDVMALQEVRNPMGRSCKTQLLEIGAWTFAFLNVALGVV